MFTDQACMTVEFNPIYKTSLVNSHDFLNRKIIFLNAEHFITFNERNIALVHY